MIRPTIARLLARLASAMSAAANRLDAPMVYADIAAHVRDCERHAIEHRRSIVESVPWNGSLVHETWFAGTQRGGRA